MKKILVALVAMMCSVSTFAQYSSGGFSLDDENLYWGVRFGITGASLGGDLDCGMRAGMTLGGVVGLRASDSTPVFIESGLYYTQRGGKSSKKITNVQSVSYNCLEIPLIVKYGIQATDEIAVLPFAGPYFSYAIAGKTKQFGNKKEEKNDGKKQSVGTFEEKEALTGGLKRFNMGFKIGVGAEYNKMYLELGYQFGITNVCKADNMSSRSNALFANFGVNF